jgi:dienelactone hydrolase
MTTCGAEPTSAWPHDVDHPWRFEPTFKDQAAWEARAEALRTQVLVAAGLWPMPEKTPLNAVIHGRIERDEYTIEKVYFASMPGHYVTGNLYRPKNRKGKCPGVASPYGHWPGGRFIWLSDADAKKQIDKGAEQTMNSARSPLQARCAMLACMGCVVFHYDMLGYGDSTAIEHREGFDDVEATLRLQSQLGLQTWNSIRVLDFLSELPDVDPSRLAVTGASGGGTQTILLGAVDPRPIVSFPQVMVSQSMQGGCVCENAPLLRVGTNNVELTCLFAPRALAMGGANDWTIKIETEALPQAKAIYGLYGKTDLVDAKHFPFDHNFNQPSREYMYTWLNKHLNLGWESPVHERPFEPAPPEQLHVFDDAHPMPKDALDAAALRKQMSKASDAQVAKMSADELRKGLQAVAAHGPWIESGLTEKLANWSGRIVIWFEDGKPLDDASRRRLTDTGAMVWTRSLPQLGPIPAKVKRGTYAGYTLGYNDSGLAKQAAFVARVLAVAKTWPDMKSIDVVGAGPGVLLGVGISDVAPANTIIDLEKFDFDQITEPSDPRILPGALKYGGVFGFARLCRGSTLLTNAPRAATIPGVTIQESPLDPASTVSLLLK